MRPAHPVFRGSEDAPGRTRRPLWRPEPGLEAARGAVEGGASPVLRLRGRWHAPPLRPRRHHLRGLSNLPPRPAVAARTFPHRGGLSSALQAGSRSSVARRRPAPCRATCPALSWRGARPGQGEPLSGARRGQRGGAGQAGTTWARAVWATRTVLGPGLLGTYEGVPVPAAGGTPPTRLPGPSPRKRTPDHAPCTTKLLNHPLLPGEPALWSGLALTNGQTGTVDTCPGGRGWLQRQVVYQGNERAVSRLL